MVRSWLRSGILALSLILLAGQAFADEGMWTFDNLPLKAIREKYGVELTEAWIKRVRLSSVRFNNGGSGSFVSADGLVMTNHHVARDVLQDLSTSKNNLLKKGFQAKTRDKELKAPNLELNVLMSIEDVTARVKAAVTPEMDVKAAAEARKRIMAEIERESLDQTGFRSDVVTLYQGGLYHLYRYKKYTDVRLVFAPEATAAAFGGDPDNFEFPRFDLDATFFRVYEDGKPVKVDNFLPWSSKGAKENDPVFVSGHPGTTNRVFTLAAMEYLRDQGVPRILDYLRRQEQFCQLYAQKGPEQAFQAKAHAEHMANGRKVYLGELKGLQDEDFFRVKEQEELALRAKALGKVQGDPWATIEETYKLQLRYMKRYRLFEAAWAFQSEYFGFARTLVRMNEENTKPEGERLKEFRESRRPTLEQGLFSEAKIYNEFEIAKLAHSLSFLIEELGHNDPLVKRVMQGRTVEARARELVEGTSLGDVAVRKHLSKAGKRAILRSYDPMIRLALEVDNEARRLRKIFENRISEPREQAYAEIAKVKFALYGTDTYPDATFTLRLAYGAVEGVEQDGQWVPPFTTLGGAFEHEKAHSRKEPYRLPPPWHRNKARLALDTPLNLISTTDITGGNSGSPMVDRDGNVVGLIFDGNRDSHMPRYNFAGAPNNRAVSVDVRGILELLKHAYNADSLVKELEASACAAAVAND